MDTIAFMGCGWRFPFMFGVAKYIEDHNHYKPTKYIGVSGGAVVSYSLLSNKVDAFYESAIARKQASPFAPFGMCDFIEIVARENATLVPTGGSLTIIASRLKPNLTAEYMSEFDSIDDLCKCMRASSHIPFFGGSLWYEHRNHYYMDGEFSVNTKDVRSQQSPCIIVDFCDAADIKPSIQFPRWWSYIPQNDSTMKMMYDHGYEQAKEYFKKVTIYY